MENRVSFHLLLPHQPKKINRKPQTQDSNIFLFCFKQKHLYIFINQIVIDLKTELGYRSNFSEVEELFFFLKK